MKCDSPFYVLPAGATERVPVPCNRCPPCKINRVNSWVFRLLQEEKLHAHAHFVTFTYDTHCVPISPNGFMTLKKSDFQDYMKRLRNLCPGQTLKYYAVGEYGTKNSRPHYHAIIFGVDDPNKFADAWMLKGQSLGGVYIGKVSSNSIAYTMKYIDKSNFKRKHKRDDREPEFPLMSQGLGKNYLTPEIIAYHQADKSRLYCTREGGHKIALPRYYKQKLYSEDDRKQQALLAAAESQIKEDAMRRTFFQNYPDRDEAGFLAWKESTKYARYDSFYKNQNSRNL